MNAPLPFHSSLTANECLQRLERLVQSQAARQPGGTAKARIQRLSKTDS